MHMFFAYVFLVPQNHPEKRIFFWPPQKNAWLFPVSCFCASFLQKSSKCQGFLDFFQCSSKHGEHLKDFFIFPSLSSKKQLNISRISSKIVENFKDFFIFPECSSKSNWKNSRISFQTVEHFDVSLGRLQCFLKVWRTSAFFLQCSSKKPLNICRTYPKVFEKISNFPSNILKIWQDFCNYPECWQTLHLIAAPLNLTLQRMHFELCIFWTFKNKCEFSYAKKMLYECICIFSSWQKICILDMQKICIISSILLGTCSVGYGKLIIVALWPCWWSRRSPLAHQVHAPVPNHEESNAM